MSRAAAVLSCGLQSWAVAADGSPLLAEAGDGAHLVDSAGRRYVDWVMGWGSLLLGYRRPEIEAAIREQLGSGTLFSVPHVLEVEVAERLRAQIPCAEKVAFGKNGSDVCAAAVRIARAVTGRDSILQYGYHGFHDWCAALNSDAEGVPAVLRPLIHAIPYNDAEALRAILSVHGDRIAGVIMEPMRDELPAAGYLEAVRALTREHDVLLIFDEMVTGFRLAPGGAQQLFGVTPDLACIGKALTNGLPLSALVGGAELMDVLGRVGYGMTARGETLALAAARAALDVQAGEPVAERVSQIGEKLRAGFAASCAQQGIAAALTGHPAMLTFVLPDGWRKPFLHACRERGVLTNGHLLPSTAHDESAIDASCAAFDAALAVCNERQAM